MSDIPSFAGNPIIFFLSRILILLGMVLVFAISLYIVGFVFLKFALGVDISMINQILLEPEANAGGITALKIFNVFISIGTFVIPAFMFSLALNQKPVLFLKIRHPVKVYNYAFAIFLIIVSIPLTSWLYTINQQMKLPDGMADFEQYIKTLEESAKHLTEIFVRADTWSEYLLNVFVMAVVPAITEEIFFRGCLQNFVRMCFYNIHVSVIFAALIFSGVHGQFYGFLPRFELGIILGYAFAYSGNIWVSIAGHFFNNAIALTGSFIDMRNINIEFLKEDYIFPFYINIISLVLTVLIIYMMNRLRYKNIFIEDEK